MRIHQLLGSLEFADAVATYALTVQRLLRDLGHESEIFVAGCDPRVAELCRPLADLPEDDSVVTIYHHTFWSEPTLQKLRRLRGRRALIYHNVTPDHFFAGWDEELGDFARRAREELGELRGIVDVAIAGAPFNRHELADLGFEDVAVLPMPVALDRLSSTAPDAPTLEKLADGAVNFLFVGRLVPSKRQEDVIRVFAWYHRFIHRPSRLVLVGSAPELDVYRRSLDQVARDNEVDEHVVFTGKISDAELVACYRAAHVFVCMSEHEGFCAPLVECMLYDVPVLARAMGAVPETLGAAGVLVHERNIPAIAETAHALISDRELRARVIAAQRERLAAFSPEHFTEALARVVARLSP